MQARPFTSRKRTAHGTCTRTVTDGQMNAVAYESDDIHFLDVNVHSAQTVRVDEVLGSVALVVRAATGNTYVTLYGISLDTLASAVEAAQRAVAV